MSLFKVSRRCDSNESKVTTSDLGSWVARFPAFTIQGSLSQIIWAYVDLWFGGSDKLSQREKKIERERQWKWEKSFLSAAWYEVKCLQYTYNDWLPNHSVRSSGIEWNIPVILDNMRPACWTSYNVSQVTQVSDCIVLVSMLHLERVVVVSNSLTQSWSWRWMFVEVHSKQARSWQPVDVTRNDYWSISLSNAREESREKERKRDLERERKMTKNRKKIRDTSLWVLSRLRSTYR